MIYLIGHFIRNRYIIFADLNASRVGVAMLGICCSSETMGPLRVSYDQRPTRMSTLTARRQLPPLPWTRSFSVVICVFVLVIAGKLTIHLLVYLPCIVGQMYIFLTVSRKTTTYFYQHLWDHVLVMAPRQIKSNCMCNYNGLFQRDLSTRLSSDVESSNTHTRQGTQCRNVNCNNKLILKKKLTDKIYMPRS